MPSEVQKKSPTAPGASTTSGGAATATRQPRGNTAVQEAMRARREGADQRYTSSYAKGGPRGEAYQVTNGRRTVDAEGTEGGRFHSRTAHVPPGPSGVTLGRGFDLGEHSGAQIVAALSAAGVSKAAAAAYAKAAGLKGEAARAWLGRHKGTLQAITPEQQEALFETTYREMSKDVQRSSDNKDGARHYGAADLDQMIPAIRAPSSTCGTGGTTPGPPARRSRRLPRRTT